MIEAVMKTIRECIKYKFVSSIKQLNIQIRPSTISLKELSHLVKKFYNDLIPKNLRESLIQEQGNFMRDMVYRMIIVIYHNKRVGSVFMHQLKEKSNIFDVDTFTQCWTDILLKPNKK